VRTVTTLIFAFMIFSPLFTVDVSGGFKAGRMACRLRRSK
jgi:hypothetical protein